MAVRVPPVLIVTVGILVLFLMYRSLPLDITCRSIGGGGWMDASPHSDLLHTREGTIPATGSVSIKDFFQEKIAKGVFKDPESKELAGLDFSTRALLWELVQSVTQTNAVSVAEQEGLFNFNYGVMRVVKRVVVCSAYRTSLRDFTLITLSPEFTIFTSNPDFKGIPPRDPAIYPKCVWLEGGNDGAPIFLSSQAMNETGRASVHNGVTKFKWLNEVHGTSYDTVMVHCSFPGSVGTEAGGFLYLNISHGLIGTGAPSELVPVYRERPNELKPALYEATSFQYEYAYCSAPSFTSLIPAHVKQFLMYHHALFEGKMHFFFYYSAQLEDETMAVLRPLIDAGILTLVNFSKENNYHIMYHGQAPAINDCLYRTRYLARWSFFWDLDEYFLIPSTSTYSSLSEILEEHKDAPWISFGKYDFRYSYCSANKTSHDWAVERMLYRMERPFCMDTCSGERCGEMCRSEKGMRKWIANPRKAKSAVTHSISDPKDMPDGVVLNTKVARFNHYRGLVAPRAANNCQEVVDPKVKESITDFDGKTTLIMDDELAKFVTSTIRSRAETLEVFGGSF